jgi:hypothetical protein
VFGLWTLAQRNFHEKPWVILDFKRDPMIKQIARLEETNIKRSPPTHKGLYVTRPTPGDVDDGHVSRWLFDVWSQEDTGIFIDEGYMIKPMDRALRAVLSQGRSKHVPVIALSQRPAWISPFISSEASHFTVFYLQMPQDISRVREYLPNADPFNLPPHHSYHASMKTRELTRLGPCPDENEVLDMFDARKVRRWFL